MPLFNVDFFNRELRNIFHDSISNSEVTDDYIRYQNNTVEIRSTDAVSIGDYIYISDGEARSYFGVVAGVDPAEHNTTKITYKSFLSVFDESILFDVRQQKQTVTVEGSSTKVNPISLEALIAGIIDAEFIHPSDVVRTMPIEVAVGTNTPIWNLGIISDYSGSNYAIIGFYKDVIVPAMKEYGVAISIEPDFIYKKIVLTIQSEALDAYTVDIDCDQSNIIVKTMNVSNKPTDVNKLIVYNSDDYTQKLTFYVYENHEWGIENRDRITPVVQDVRSAIPDSSFEDPAEGFAAAAIDVAYGVFSGITWNNLIEIDVAVNDPVVQPTRLKFGQKVRLWYKDGIYTSILTARNWNTNSVLLIFGSERISFTKRFSW